MNVEKEIRIQTKKSIFIVAIIITVALLTLSLLVAYWWAGLLLSIIINYFYFQECYPSISMEKAEKIMGSTRVYHAKNENIPCPVYILRLMADKNSELRYKNKDYRWHLSTDLDFFEKQSIESQKDYKKKNHKMTIERICGSDCFFFTQKVYSDGYIEEEKKNRKLRKIQKDLDKKI